ncbi:molybdopterin-dependent oxidoreductase [Kineosporia sp. R_H_3]|uniref:molybdopterin-dependent oxidoreductase n=1 Tax=Kineosporia sp. R_H_3 TaxID=1961848 RepID=UPI000B4B2245|nr:molybdopterin-dependent oxidoreductase [Kineosporia sp. R_H_3]
MTTTSTTPRAPRAATAGRRDVRGALAAAAAGVVSGALTLGVADLAAGVVAPGASPVLAVGRAAIDLVPGPLKDFAVSTFGAYDKVVLLAGIGAVLVAASAVAGLLARRRPAAGLALVVLLGAAAVASAVTRPDVDPGLAGILRAAVPTVLGVVAGGAALVLLARRVRSARAVTGGASSGLPAELPAELPADLPVAEPPVADLPRRPVLGSLLAVGGTAVLAGAGGRVLAARRAAAVRPSDLVLPRPADPAAALPAAVEVDVPGVTPFVTANRDFYRVDTALTVPRVDAGTWRLRLHGLVEREVTLSLDDVLAEPLVERTMTLTCVSNEVGGRLAGTSRWLGLPLKSLLEKAGPLPDADMVLSTSADGFTASTPLAALLDGRDALLAVGMNGSPLPVDHGFPARMIVPGLYGYVSATKWVVDLEVTRFDRATAYWTRRGWAAQAPVRTFSRIDVPASFAQVPAGRTAVAGVAWAQHRGVDAVEVRVDGGPWQPATLGAVPSLDTWRQWVFAWDAEPGQHTLEVRATDATGDPQPQTRRPPRPDGATGWHSVVVRVG